MENGPASTDTTRAFSKWSVLGVLVIPLIVAVLFFQFRSARGPLWLGSNSDPDYAYLFNSLRVCQFKAPLHIDHPGTPLQVLGAPVIGAVYQVMGKDLLVTDVLKRPELYLDAIRFTLLAFHILALLTLGVVILKTTGSLCLAILSQVSILLYPVAAVEIATVRPEYLLMILNCFYSGALLAFCLRGSDSRSNYFAGIFGVLVGLAVATKLTAAPLAIIPLVALTGIRTKILYCFATGGSFLVALAPIIAGGHWYRLVEWVTGLLSHTGQYGCGPTGFICLGDYANALGCLASSNLPELGIVLLSAFILLWNWVAHRGKGTGSWDRVTACLAGVVLAQALQFLMAARHPADRYLIPSLSLLGTNLTLMLVIVLRITKWRRNLVAFCFVGLVALTVATYAFPALWSKLRYLEDVKTSSLKTHEQAKRCRSAGWTIVNYYNCSALGCAMTVGNWSTFDIYDRELKSLYPDHIEYNIWARLYYRFGEKLSSDEVIQPGARTLFHGNPGTINWNEQETGFILKPVYVGLVETLFRLEKVEEP